MSKSKNPSTCNDKRYINKQILIYQVIDQMLANDDYCPYITEFSRRAGINKATFYRHHSNISDAIASREQHIISGMKDCIDSSNLEIALYRLFRFISMNPAYFKSTTSKVNVNLLRILKSELRPLIFRFWRSRPTPGLDYCYQMLTTEIFYEIFTWIYEENFDNAKIAQHVNTIMRLTRTAKARFRYSSEF